MESISTVEGGMPNKIDGFYRSATGFNYTNLYLYEHYFFHHESVRRLMKTVEENRNFGLYLAVIYVVVIFSLKSWMKDREKMNLRWLLVAWNVLLAVFSIFASVRVLPETYYVFKTKGLEYSLCNREFIYGVGGLWSYLFAMSKIPELVDTLFVVLRKQPLIFLHWYHHASVMVYSYYWYADVPSTSRWFGPMNYFVHSLMYTYYALKAMRVQLPKKLSIMVTSLQLGQMIVGIGICLYVLYMKQFDTPARQCQTSWENLKHSFLMYFSYFLLFLNFFLRAYVFKKPSGVKHQHNASTTKTPVDHHRVRKDD